jgi:glutamate-ammonia-ligase adenylyltransferase
MFRARLTRAPLPFDPEAGAAVVDAIAPPPEARDLVAGTAGCSPFLAAAMQRERDWLAGTWDRSPEQALEDLIAGIAAIEGDPKGPLRIAKGRGAILVGLAELGGAWEVMEAAAAWTCLADAALSRALSRGLERYATGPVDGDGGLVAIAMGKMGAGELNYSSDIDIVLLFDETRYDPADYATARAILLKAARHAMALLSEVTGDGYVFRTDLRLRPDPGSTPIVLSMEAAERYYEAMGRTWERAAWIKARPAAGDLAAGGRFLERLAPFVWRRHLDFAAVQDAHDMRLRIRDHKGYGGPWEVPGHDLKLGQGGIREIEFYAQTQQIVLGGRNPSLRVRATLPALNMLMRAGAVPTQVTHDLTHAYKHLRRVEHRVQMVQDAQTHRLPSEPEGMRRIACFMGEGDADAFASALHGMLAGVEAVVAPAFEPRRPAPAPDPIPGADAVTARWATYPALRSARAREICGRLRPTLLGELARAARPAEALAAFDAFLAGLPAGVQVLSLFEANPRLVSLLSDICATAPDLARHLSRNAATLDAVIDGRFLAPLPSRYAPPPPAGGFEADLDALRVWHRESHFRIGVHLLRGLATPAEAGRAYAALARATLRAAWDAAEVETARRYGRVPGLSVGVLGMGSLGGGRLTARSDLDLVVLHDGGDGATSDGRRALAPGQWAAKATQVLITALTAPTGEGRLYEVDMRLRPSGKQGPVATALSGFRSYQASEAWVWEHLALTRALPICGSRRLRTAIERARRQALAESRFDVVRVRSDVADMVRRLRAAAPGGWLDPKAGPGGVQEIELLAQAHALLAGCPARDVGAQLRADGPFLSAAARTELAELHAKLVAHREALRLLTGGASVEALGTGGCAFLCAQAGAEDMAALEAMLTAARTRAKGIVATTLESEPAAG